MARVNSCSAYRAKSEEEFSRGVKGRPKIGPHAKTEEEAAWNKSTGLPQYAAPCEGRGDARPIFKALFKLIFGPQGIEESGNSGIAEFENSAISEFGNSGIPELRIIGFQWNYWFSVELLVFNGIVNS